MGNSGTNDHQHCADITFLALTVWREARGEALDAKRAVASCILNRVHKPGWWGNDIMSVVFKKWQFSSLTDPKDPQLTTWPRSGDPSWTQALMVADAILNGIMSNPVPGADSYFDISITAPKWADDKLFVAQIGRLRFYNIDRDVEA